MSRVDASNAREQAPGDDVHVAAPEADAATALPPACFGRVLLNHDRLASDPETAAAYALWLMLYTSHNDRVYSPSSSAIYRGLLHASVMTLMTVRELKEATADAADGGGDGRHEAGAPAPGRVGGASGGDDAGDAGDADNDAPVLVVSLTSEPSLYLRYSKPQRAMFLTACFAGSDADFVQVVVHAGEVCRLLAWLGRKALVMVGMDAFMCTAAAAAAVARDGPGAGVDADVIHALHTVAAESVSDDDTGPRDSARPRARTEVLYEPVQTDAYVCV